MEYPRSGKTFFFRGDTENVDVEFADEDSQDETQFQFNDEDEQMGAVGGAPLANGSHLPRGTVEIDTLVTDYIKKPDGTFDRVQLKSTMTVDTAFVRAAEKSVYKAIEEEKKWTDEQILPVLMTQEPFRSLQESYVRGRVKSAWRRLVKRARESESKALKTGMGEMGAAFKSTPDDLMDDKVMDILQMSRSHNLKVDAVLNNAHSQFKIKNKDNAELAKKLRAEATYNKVKPVSTSKLTVAKVRVEPSSTITSGSFSGNLPPRRSTKKPFKKSSVFEQEFMKQVVVSSDDDDQQDVGNPKGSLAARKAAIEGEIEADGYYTPPDDLMVAIKRSLNQKEESNKLKEEYNKLKAQELAQGSPSSSGSGSGTEERLRNLEEKAAKTDEKVDKIIKYFGIQ